MRVCVINFLVKLIALSNSSVVPLDVHVQRLLDDFFHHFVLSLTTEVCMYACRVTNYFCLIT